jgi:hypothetical protein
MDFSVSNTTGSHSPLNKSCEQRGKQMMAKKIKPSNAAKNLEKETKNSKGNN